MDNNLKHSEDFIRNKVGNNTGFSAPKNYFQNLEDNLLSTVVEEKLPAQTSFEVPSDYFSKLEDEILAKVAVPKKEVKVIPLRKRILQYASIASAACVLLFVGLQFFNKTTTTLNDITVADIENWYDNSYETIDSNELALVLTEDDLNENDFFNTENSTELEEYLENIDPTLLNEI